MHGIDSLPGMQYFFEGIVQYSELQQLAHIFLRHNIIKTSY